MHFIAIIFVIGFLALAALLLYVIFDKHESPKAAATTLEQNFVQEAQRGEAAVLTETRKVETEVASEIKKVEADVKAKL